MDKALKRIFIPFLFLTIILSVNVSAKTVTYSARTISFPNSAYSGTYGAGWSNQFTLSTRSKVTINCTLLSPSGTSVSLNTLTINQNLKFIVENVTTNKLYSLSVPDDSLNTVSYQLSLILKAGTYSFGAYSYSSESFRLRFVVKVHTGISLPDKISVMKSKKVKTTITEADGSSTSATITDVEVGDTSIAKASYSGKVLTVKGVAVGTTTVTVYMSDGSYDTADIEVTKYVLTPVLKYKSVTMVSGESVKNSVQNATGTVTWSSTDTSVAKVNKKGKITAVAYGTCNIYASFGGTRLVCKVTVNHIAPSYTAWIKSYNADTLIVRITIKNTGTLPIIVYNSPLKIYRLANGAYIRKLTLNNNKNYVTVGAGKKKNIWLKLKKKLPSTDLSLYRLVCKFSYDSAYYYGSMLQDKTNSMYRLKTKGSTWYYSYD